MCMCCGCTAPSNRACLPTEIVFLPASSFPPLTRCHCKRSAEFSISNSSSSPALSIFTLCFPRFSSAPFILLFPLPLSHYHFITTALSPSLSHFLEAHLKSLIVQLSLCSTQRIINSTGAASRSFSLLC